jgi:phospholipase A-2-activating protein
MNPVLYEGGNFDGLSKKIFEFNEALKDTPHQMKEAEVNRLNKVLEKLKDTENYYQTTFTELETEVITLKLLKWPSEYLVPVLDLFRLFLIHHNSEKLFSGLDCGLAYLSLICQVLRATTSDVVLVLCLKILCNLMKHLNNKTSLMKYQDMIVEALENINIQKKEKDTVRSALASFAFNLSTGANVASDLAIEKLIGLISEALKYENNQENIFKYLIGYGNILALNPTGLAVASSIGLKNIIQNINVTADNSQGCKTDLINWLS